jgi:hypothetical protein
MKPWASSALTWGGGVQESCGPGGESGEEANDAGWRASRRLPCWARDGARSSGSLESVQHCEVLWGWSNQGSTWFYLAQKEHPDLSLSPEQVTGRAMTKALLGFFVVVVILSERLVRTQGRTWMVPFHGGSSNCCHCWEQWMGWHFKKSNFPNAKIKRKFMTQKKEKILTY